MFIFDDILLRSIGFSFPGLDLLWVFEQMRDFAYKEMHDQIKDKIKENRMLYELGEMTSGEYFKMNDILTRQLKLAERAKSMNIGQRTDLLGNEA